MKIAFGKMCVTLCGRFDLDEGGVAGYVDRIGGKYTAKWGVRIVGMNFQTHSSTTRKSTSPALPGSSMAVNLTALFFRRFLTQAVPTSASPPTQLIPSAYPPNRYTFQTPSYPSSAPKPLYSNQAEPYIFQPDHCHFCAIPCLFCSLPI